MRQRSRPSYLRPVVALDDHAYAYNPDTGALVVVQHWSGFPGGRDALIIVAFRDGHRVRPREQMDTHRTTTDRFHAARKGMAGRIVTERRAREILEAMGGPANERCTQPSCGAQLPIGGRWCTQCGTAYNVPQPSTVLPAAARRIPR